VKFCLSIHLLLSAFHGRRDGDLPEWPPSPLRVFQSLVSVAGARGNGELPARFRSALTWLEKQPAPAIIAPTAVSSAGYSLSVPNNAMDVVARAWVRGNYSDSGDASPATHRTMKRVRPTLLPDNCSVHFLWSLPEPMPDAVGVQLEALAELACSLSALGWGIDVAVGSARALSDEAADELTGVRWIPDTASAEDGLRIPNEGTTNELIDRHGLFVSRLSGEGLKRPPPISAYRIVDYRSAYSGRGYAVAAFSLLKSDASGFRVFNPVLRTSTVVEMVRGAAERSANRAGWSEGRIATVVLGHAEPREASKHSPVRTGRFAWLPLPSLEVRGKGGLRTVGGIRRILVTSFDLGIEDEIEWARKAISGEELIRADGSSEGFLSTLPKSDPIIREYLKPSTTWATVTPVVLPGYDDPNHYRRQLRDAALAAEERKSLLARIQHRVDGLLRKAIVHSGLSRELAARAELRWQTVGFLPGTDLAGRYAVPDHLRRFPRLHVKISWRDADNRKVVIPGPVCIGGGRFYGLGLFAPVGG
jgi:CRISPR-associated protein Csb2